MGYLEQTPHPFLNLGNGRMLILYKRLNRTIMRISKQTTKTGKTILTTITPEHGELSIYCPDGVDAMIESLRELGASKAAEKLVPVKGQFGMYMKLSTNEVETDDIFASGVSDDEADEE